MILEKARVISLKNISLVYRGNPKNLIEPIKLSYINFSCFKCRKEYHKNLDYKALSNLKIRKLIKASLKLYKVNFLRKVSVTTIPPIRRYLKIIRQYRRIEDRYRKRNIYCERTEVRLENILLESDDIWFELDDKYLTHILSLI